MYSMCKLAIVNVNICQGFFVIQDSAVNVLICFSTGTTYPQIVLTFPTKKNNGWCECSITQTSPNRHTLKGNKLIYCLLSQMQRSPNQPDDKYKNENIFNWRLRRLMKTFDWRDTGILFREFYMLFLQCS